MWNITSSKSLPIALVIGGIIVLGAISINTFYSLNNPGSNAQNTDEEEQSLVTQEIERVNKIQPSRNLTSIDIKEGPSEDYQMPETVTGRASISLMKNIILAMGNGSLKGNEELLAEATSKSAIAEMRTVAITLPEVNTGNQTARAYANQAAETILNNDLKETDDGISMLNRALQSEDPAEVEKEYDNLERLATMYQTITDELKTLTVPAELAEEHVYLVNSFNAMAASLSDMAQTETDPMRAYIRLSRYTEDVKAMEFAMQNLAMGLIRTQEPFQPNDPALLFSTLLPEIKS